MTVAVVVVLVWGAVAAVALENAGTALAMSALAFLTVLTMTG
jgi:hypothetical protein